MEPPISRSRLEINFIRLLEETQQMANGSAPKNWTFEKWMEDRTIVVLYGSQTGTAQELAERIGREAHRYYFKPSVSSMDDFPVEGLAGCPLVAFVASTTGQGDDPDNMREFFGGLWSRRKNRRLLASLNFGVVGLGDSSYRKFNYSAKRLNNLLTFLGGRPLLKVGLGDDQHDLGPDFVVDPWLRDWWGKVLELYPLPEGVVPRSANFLLPSKFKVKFVEDGESRETHVESQEAPAVRQQTQTTHTESQEEEASALSPCYAEVTMNRRVTSSDHFQDVRLIEFDTSRIRTRHKPGDVLMVQPQNLEEHVQEFLDVLGLDPERSFYLEANDANVSSTPPPPPPSYVLPRPCSMRECVRSYLDIQAVPKRRFFELLAFFSKDETESEKFRELSSPEGQEDLFNYCTRPKRTVLEVLADFPRTKGDIPLDYLFDLVPAIRPRPYSIASSDLAVPGRAQLLVAVVQYTTVLRRPRLGLCTNWLARRGVGSRVPVWVKAGTLTFPDPSRPVLMIGPGTGCAPFRAYIQERIAGGRHERLVLVFGCRYKNGDYFFRDEWEALAREGRLELHCAFSRDQESKVYVQHRMREEADSLWNLVGDGRAMIYFAGNAKRVPIDVYEALTYICERGRGLGPQDAEQFMKKEVEKRYQTETWA